MVICHCGRWMHTAGVDESFAQGDAGQAAAGNGATWIVRFECGGCQRSIGLIASSDQASAFVDRLTWTDDAQHRLDRLPPYVQILAKDDVDAYARSTGTRIVTCSLFEQARRGASIRWAPDAEQRLLNVPAGVRAMARTELERTAMERGQVEVTVALMEEVKARYFGMSGR